MKLLKFCAICALCVTFLSCEKTIVGSENTMRYGNVHLTFEPTNGDMTRGIDNYFTKLNVQLFDEEGNKVFSTVRTQTKDDEGFGTMSLKLSAGKYTVVAVGHSSAKSATIKSPEVVQFTASDGTKLTDTFCACEKIEIDDDGASIQLPMYRVGAMIQLILTDSIIPENFSYLRMDYTGGSANFNPTTFQGITKSTQSEKRIANDIMIYQAFTFPYMAKTGTINMTVTATDFEGTMIRQKTIEDIPVTRNRITTYKGPLFGEGDGVFSQSDFSFVIHADWDGEDIFEF